MKKYQLKFIISVLIIFIISSTFFYLDYKKFIDTPLNIKVPFIFEIEPGISFRDLNKKLKSSNVLDDHYYLELYVRYSGYAKKIQSGEYRLTPGLLPHEIINIFISGDVVQHSITLVEGWRVDEMLTEISSNNILRKILKNYSAKTLLSTLGITGSHAEGLFFPDTYYFTKGTTDIEILRRAYQRRQSILRQEWEQRDSGLPYRNAYDALIMASIIEKETALATERPLIAGVFVRRLQKKMKLQTDPTVVYAMGDQYNGNIKKKDLSIDSPYNTYRYHGLPPSPIALAGQEAIYAALHPKLDETLYFVAKKDGSHYFSKTLEEHNRAVKKYQLNK